MLLLLYVLLSKLCNLANFFCSFKQIANSRPLSELRSPEEAKAAAEEAVPVAEDATLADDTDEPPKPEKVGGLTEAEELEKYLGIREALYRKAKEWDSRIRDFETAIRRPYFHVKPLDDMQLGNWHRYLDFIEKEGDLDRVSCSSVELLCIFVVLNLFLLPLHTIKDHQLGLRNYVYRT